MWKGNLRFHSVNKFDHVTKPYVYLKIHVHKNTLFLNFTVHLKLKV